MSFKRRRRTKGEEAKGKEGRGGEMRERGTGPPFELFCTTFFIPNLVSALREKKPQGSNLSNRLIFPSQHRARLGMSGWERPLLKAFHGAFPSRFVGEARPRTHVQPRSWQEKANPSILGLLTILMSWGWDQGLQVHWGEPSSQDPQPPHAIRKNWLCGKSQLPKCF